MGEAGGGQLVSDGLGHVELVEVGGKPEVHPAAGEVGAEKPVARPRLEQPRGVHMLDRGRVRVEVHVRLAEWPTRHRLRFAAVHRRRLPLLVEPEGDRAKVERGIRHPLGRGDEWSSGQTVFRRIEGGGQAGEAGSVLVEPASAVEEAVSLVRLTILVFARTGPAVGNEAEKGPEAPQADVPEAELVALGPTGCRSRARSARQQERRTPSTATVA